jgi:putative spermidine/putrescine transport system ATP-binding protein/spermidine/putrescine transport system ATP-binding protein
MSAVELHAVAKFYGAACILDHISAHFEAGQLTSLLGPSGSGKTTLLRIIAGFVEPDEGQVTIGNTLVTHEPVWRRGIGMVFQSYALFPHMSVTENVKFGLYRRGVRGAEAERRVKQVLEMVRLSGFDDRRPKQLSGGQQQRVALARAIVTRPKVLLLDEPLSALDRRLRQEMQVELHRIQRESGLTTIFVTHDQEEALTLSDRVAILDRGRIVQDGKPADVYDRPRTRFAASFLGDANFLDGRIDGDVVVVGDARIRTTDQLPANGTVTLAVRPEKIALTAVGESDGVGNRLKAVVRDVIYAGAASTYFMEGPNGLALKVFSQNRDQKTMPAGTSMLLHWQPAHTVVLQE